MTTTLIKKHQQLQEESSDSAANKSWFDETEADEQNRMAVSCNNYHFFNS